MFESLDPDESQKEMFLMWNFICDTYLLFYFYWNHYRGTTEWQSFCNEHCKKIILT